MALLHPGSFLRGLRCLVDGTYAALQLIPTQIPCLTLTAVVTRLPPRDREGERRGAYQGWAATHDSLANPLVSRRAEDGARSATVCSRQSAVPRHRETRASQSRAAWAARRRGATSR